MAGVDSITSTHIPKPYTHAEAYVGPHFCVLGPMLGLIWCAGAYAGPHVGGLGPMLGFIWCTGADAETHCCVPGPMLGLIFLFWGLCWA